MSASTSQGVGDGAVNVATGPGPGTGRGAGTGTGAGRHAPRVSKARIVAVTVVGAGLAAGAAVAGATGGAEPRVTLPPTALAAEAAPLASQSSGWYCTGGVGKATPPAGTSIVLANTGPRRVTGTLHVVDTAGATGRAAFDIAPGAQIEEDPGTVVDGTWLATRVDVHGGGVTATERVQSQWGTTVSPCSSETARRWYFAQGSTAAGASMFVSVFNPTANLAVVDLTFLTASGVISPAPDQGLVIGPGKAVTVTVGKYVQDKSEVATIVSARSGAVTAAELQRYDDAGVTGTSLVLGTPAALGTWDLPQLVDVAGGSSQVEVLNPSPKSAHVTVAVRLASGTAAPFDATIPPSSVWTLRTSSQLRIPVGTDYSLQVTATGAPGVVVGRIGEGTAHSGAPGWGSQTAIAAPVLPRTTVRRWIVPSLGTAPAGTAATGTAGAGTAGSGTAAAGTAAAATSEVLFENPGSVGRRATVWAESATGARRVSVVRIPARSTATLPAGGAPLLVDANGPLAIEAVGSSAAAGGVVALPAVPQG